MLVSIKKAASILGVAQNTLRIWESNGKLIPARTPKGHRRYDLAVLYSLAGRKAKPSDNKKTICYSRVSTLGQKEDLKRQSHLLEAYCASNGWQFSLIEDFGSGINFRKKGLLKLLSSILEDEVERLVLTNKDRLLRFGTELVFAICEHKNIEIVIINKSLNEISFEEELSQDVLEIITVFSARLYGKRSHKTKKMLHSIQEELNEP